MSFKFQEVKIKTALSFFLGYIYGEITNSKNSPTKVGIHLVFSLCLDSSHVQRFCAFSVFCGSCALFTGPASTFFRKTTLKLGLTLLFTHLKIILLECFQFLVFNNKRYPNRLLVEKQRKWFACWKELLFS